MNELNDQTLRETAARLLRRSERELDELTVARLRAARRRALEAAPGRNRPFALAGGLVAAGMAFGLAAVVWLRAPSELPAPDTTGTQVADFDLLTTESPDFYSELEFYRWLASQSDAG